MAIICPNCYRQYDVTLFQFGTKVTCDCGNVFNPFDSALVEYPIDGILDLHTFRASEVKELVPEYLEACLQKEIFRVRIIHGKGRGALLRTVHSILQKCPLVQSFELAKQDEGGWGATIVQLKTNYKKRPGK
jgi:hypothetical protein